MEYYFDPDDKLERIKYAEFLKSMLKNCDKYRREDSDGAYVIAIDSPWGTGKTRFAKMLRNYLENRTRETPVEAPIDPTNGFLTVYYNAWDTDYSNDALEPLIYTLINSPEFESELFEQQADEEIDNFINTAKKVLKVIGLSAAHHFFGETAAKAIDACMENEEKKDYDICDYERKKEVILTFKETLNQVVEKTNKKKIVIIIDELDRCRPTFAIQTLELVKHLFAVKNLIFVFALDIEQLSISVKSVYGLNMNATGYLSRFFDYIGKMPSPNLFNFIKIHLEQHEVFTAKIKLWLWSSEITEFLDALNISFSLSLRDITTIIKTYHLLLDSFLLDYEYLQFHYLYLFLLTLKYKNTSLYADFLLNIQKRSQSSICENVKSFLPRVEKNILRILNDQLERISTSNSLRYTEFKMHTERLARKFKISEVQGIFVVVVTPTVGDKEEEVLRLATMVTDEANEASYPGNVIRFDKSKVLNDLLSYNDLKKWDQIKHLTLGQYYYQQLEMFNFALPADEPETQS